MKKIQIWNQTQKEWLIDNNIHDSEDDELYESLYDKDGYCKCTMCQTQKQIDICRNQLIEVKIPEELFEL